MKRSVPLTLRYCVSVAVAATEAVTAAVPRNYSNTPYRKDSQPVTPPSNPSHTPVQHSDGRTPAPSLKLALPLPSPMRTNYIDREERIITRFNQNHRVNSFRHRVCNATDVSMRPMMLLLLQGEVEGRAGSCASNNEYDIAQKARQQRSQTSDGGTSYGERLPNDLSCRWGKKFYGRVTFGPRNYPYPSSRWLARRFKMKKHRIVKRFRFRRYKLAAVANLPFAKMIRVGMLPELKSSKTKAGDNVEAGLSSQLVSAARTTTGGKVKGRRRRPKSKYQV